MTQTVSTYIQWHAENVRQDPGWRVKSLASKLTIKLLEESYSQVRKGGAPGVDDITWEASQEGCVGPLDLFIGICAAICMVTLYTALRPRRRPTSGDIECSKD